jgi:hypothetical protein
LRCLANSSAKHPGSCVVRYRPINSSSVGPFGISLLWAPPCITSAAHQFHTPLEIFLLPFRHTSAHFAKAGTSPGKEKLRASLINLFRPAHRRAVIAHLANAMWDTTRTGRAEEEIRTGCRSYRLFHRHNNAVPRPCQRSAHPPVRLVPPLLIAWQRCASSLSRYRTLRHSERRASKHEPNHGKLPVPTQSTKAGLISGTGRSSPLYIFVFRKPLPQPPPHQCSTAPPRPSVPPN